MYERSDKIGQEDELLILSPVTVVFRFEYQDYLVRAKNEQYLPLDEVSTQHMVDSGVLVETDRGEGFIEYGIIDEIDVVLRIRLSPHVVAEQLGQAVLKSLQLSCEQVTDVQLSCSLPDAQKDIVICVKLLQVERTKVPRSIL